MPRKYRLLSKEVISNNAGEKVKVRRIQALVDIPRHNVKKGDIGGYVNHASILSHRGDCWIGDDAIVIGDNNFELMLLNGRIVNSIKHNAFVGGNINVIESQIGCDTRITGGRATIQYGDINFTKKYQPLDLSINLKDESKIFMSYMTTNGNIDGAMNLFFASVRGQGKVDITGKIVMESKSLIHSDNDSEIIIRGHVVINKNVTLLGDINIVGDVDIHNGATLLGKTNITGKSVVPPSFRGTDITLHNAVANYETTYTKALESTKIPETIAIAIDNNDYSEYVDTLQHIEAEYESYTTDIVKLIKYPAMVDATIKEVREFMVLLKTAKRNLLKRPETLEAIVPKLEDAYCLAENVARTMATTHLPEKQVEKLKTANQLFLIACNENSTENEKRSGFKAGMRSLTGVIDVSDKAIENLKGKVGLLELEA